MNPPAGSAPGPASDLSARARAQAEWQRLEDRLATITPRAVGRYVLAAVVVLGIAWLLVATWPAVAPFVVGAGVAYTVHPIVSRLEPVLPRAVAALVAVLATLALVVGTFVVVLPALARAVIEFATELPTAAEIDDAVARLQSSLGSLPPGAADIVTNTATQLATRVHEVLDGTSNQLANLALEGVRALVGVVAVAIGLIALPTWILTVLRDRSGLRRAIDARAAQSLRSDTWAVIRIADRAGRAYIRGAIVSGLLVGALVYLGSAGASQLGAPAFANPLPVAVFAGVTQVIPAIGVLLGLLPAAIVLPVSPERAAEYLVIYSLAVWIGRSLIAGRVSGGNLHPALLVPGIVVLSQFGLLWLLLAGPVLAAVSDLIRYAHGRLSDPPRPAGVIPGETARLPVASAVSPVVPSVYLARRAR